jgi:hypothetical protein
MDQITMKTPNPLCRLYCGLGNSHATGVIGKLSSTGTAEETVQCPWSLFVQQLRNGHSTGDIGERSMTGMVGEPVSGVYWCYSWGTVIRQMLQEQLASWGGGP